MNRKQKIVTALSLVWSISLFSMATYAWVARTWTPELEYSNITIATSGALVITIHDKDGNEGQYTEVNLNELTNTETFALKQVSSADGKSFLGADFTPVLEDGVPIYDTNTSGKYLETEFWLKTQPSSDDARKNVKDVFLHPDTMILYQPPQGMPSNNVDLAVRISIEVPGFNGNQPYVLCKNRGTTDGNDGRYDNTLFAANTNAIGLPVYEEYPDETLNTQTLSPQIAYDYKYFNGESAERMMFRVNPDTVQKVIIRVWLEGCDEYCLSDIAGSIFSLNVKFDTKDIEITD